MLDNDLPNFISTSPEEGGTEGGLVFADHDELMAFVKAQRKGKAKKQFAPLFSSDKGSWETPDYFFAAVNAEFNFTVDLAASHENKKVQKYFSIEQDAFKLRWTGTGWLNPDFTNGIGRWLERAKMSAIANDATVVCLVPARTETKAWFDHARFGQVRFIKGRLKFKGAPTSAPFPSALVIFRPGLPRSTTYWEYREIKEAPFYMARQLD